MNLATCPSICAGRRAAVNDDYQDAQMEEISFTVENAGLRHQLLMDKAQSGLIHACFDFPFQFY